MKEQSRKLLQKEKIKESYLENYKERFIVESL